jgi:CBS domain-containing protein
MMNRDPRDVAEEYRDPLENYDPKRYPEPLEAALATETVAAIEAEPFLTLPPTATVEEAMVKLVDVGVACVLIEEQGKLVGVFSERDALNKIALEYERVKHLPVSQFMTTSPIFVFDTDSAAAALSVMAATGYRHVPVVDLSHRIVGIVSPQRVTSFLENYFHGDGGNS